MCSVGSIDLVQTAQAESESAQALVGLPFLSVWVTFFLVTEALRLGRGTSTAELGRALTLGVVGDAHYNGAKQQLAP